MEINNRTKVLGIVLGVVVAILVGRLFQIQILDGSYKRDASNNSMIYETIFPPRGIIYDRDGRVLVGNKVCYDILVTPREVTEFDTLALAEALGITPEFVRERMSFYKERRRSIGYQTLTFVKQLPVERYMRFAEAAYAYPGFRGQVRSIREYPFDAGGNLLGYMGEVNAADIKAEPETYKAGDYIGKTGLEAIREKELRGKKGYHIFLRDSRNRRQNAYADGEFDLPAEPGTDIVTTIDAPLQQYGQRLMAGKKGSLIAIEPATGEILAMVSSPGISVDELANIGQHYGRLVMDPNRPMFNRTVQASYPPGSVFKLVNGLIGMQEGVLEPWYKYPCTKGYAYSSKHKLGCHAHRSPLDLTEAVMMSCNAYFCYVFKNLLEKGPTAECFDRWRDYVLSFGFGAPLGSDFPSELGGNIPTSKYYDRVYGARHWRFSNVVSLSIGQGEIGATPLQIANLAAIMANRGWYRVPHIVRSSEDRFTEKHYTRVDTTHFEKVIPGMWQAVNAPWGAGGTAAAAAVPGLDICGKTGTAQNPHGADNSVFICFAPKDNPRIAVVGYVEGGGWGGSTSCPIASLLVEKYLTGEISRPALEERILNLRFIDE